MMFAFKTSSFLILVGFATILLIGCSNSPTQPPIESNSDLSENLPEFISEDNTNRSVIAMYDAVIDPVNQTFEVTPSRELSYHFPLTNLYPNSLQVYRYGWTPNFWADIRLTHPFPGSGIKGYDPRVIAILPARRYVCFDYPTLDIKGNNRVLLEPDGYTNLFDDLDILGNVNPFIAYFKDQPNRVWADKEETTETKRWQMDLNGFDGTLTFKLVVDVSTNYPNSPRPVIDNAQEPVEISIRLGDGLNDAGGSATLTATLLDWQGEDGILAVVECPDLFNGIKSLSYHRPGPNPDEYNFRVTIANDKLKPAGFYPCVIGVKDERHAPTIYQEFMLEVVEVPVTDGNLIWAKHAGGLDGEYGLAVTALSDNDVVVLGYFSGDITFNKDEIDETTLISEEYTDVFIVRYNPNGTITWIKTAGGTGFDGGKAITSLSDDSVVTCGTFQWTITFGKDEPNETILTSGHDYQQFLARYDSDGMLTWARSDGGGGDSFIYPEEITTLADNSVIVFGQFLGTVTFGQGETNETVLYSSDMSPYIVRYNSDGTLNWAKEIDGKTSSALTGGIATLPDGYSTILIGVFEGTITLGSGEPMETTLISAGSRDIFIARYNPNGTLAWAKRIGGEDYDTGYSITTHSDYSFTITGSFNGEITFGTGEPNETTLISSGSYDFYIARYNMNGLLQWAKSVGSDAGDSGRDLTTLSDDTVVVTGLYHGTMVFGENEPNETTLPITGFTDVFMARYNTDGTLAWAKCAGGTKIVWSYAITCLSDDSTILTGYFTETAIFGPGEPAETEFTAIDYNDFFVARFEP